MITDEDFLRGCCSTRISVSLTHCTFQRGFSHTLHVCEFLSHTTREVRAYLPHAAQERGVGDARGEELGGEGAVRAAVGDEGGQRVGHHARACP